LTRALILVTTSGANPVDVHFAEDQVPAEKVLDN